MIIKIIIYTKEYNTVTHTRVYDCSYSRMFIQLVPQNSILYYNIPDKLVFKLFLVMAFQFLTKQSIRMNEK